MLAWHTEDGAMVRHTGQVQFKPNDDGSTTAEIRLVYDPVAGALGHAIAQLFGVGPKHHMDDDLLRMKTYLETGKPPHDAAVRGVEPERAAPHADAPQPEQPWAGNGSGAGPA